MVRRTISFWLAALSQFPMAAQAHSGKLDAHGCHRDKKTGEYHCHSPAYVGVASIIDGDTIDIHGQRFRLPHYLLARVREDNLMVNAVHKVDYYMAESERRARRHEEI